MSIPLIIAIFSCLCLPVLGLSLVTLLHLLFRKPTRPKLGQVQLEMAPAIVELLSFDFAQPVVSEIRAIAPQATTLSDNLCLAAPDQHSLDVRLFHPHLEDLTRTVIQTWLVPTIESILDLLTKPGQAGKDYDDNLADEEPRPIKREDLKEECKHGLPKVLCAVCQEERELRRKRKGKPKPRIVNPFDLLLPFLYPPLGTNFDNAIVFPPGKDLFGFQREGVRFLAAHEAALLADEMGLGKSIQAIVATRLLFRSSDRLMDALILCPKSVLKDWQKKLQEWAPELRTTLISGPPELRRVLWNVPSHIYLAGYATLRQDSSHLTHREYAIVVLDEVQSIKNPKAKRTKAVRQIKGQRRWALSATPLENKVDDLISIFAYLKPGLLRREDAGYPQVVKRKIKPFFLRRRVETVRDEIGLGEKISRVVWLELTPEQKETYDRVVRSARRSLRPVADELARLDQRRHQSSSAKIEWRQANIRARGHVLALISKLKQICNFDPRTGKSCKADFLEGKLEGLREVDEKALIFSQYPNISLRPLMDRFSAFKPDLFDGTLSVEERHRRIERFQERDEMLVMLMSLKAGGLGVTLTRANHVFHLDHWWNPAVAAQAVGRAYRVGQEKLVFVTSLYVADTIEERIYNLLEHKRELFRQVIDDLSDEHIVGSLTTEELLELFDLVTFNVRLLKPGLEIGRVIKVVSEVAQLEHQEARQRVQRFPSVILQGVSRQMAQRAKVRLEAVGATAEVQSSYVTESSVTP